MNNKLVNNSTKQASDEFPSGPTGRREVIDGDEYFEVYHDGSFGWIPVHPDVVYGRTGEWKGWCDFLGSNDFEEVTKGMTPEEKQTEWAYYCQNRTEIGR